MTRKDHSDVSNQLVRFGADHMITGEVKSFHMRMSVIYIVYMIADWFTEVTIACGASV